MNLYSPKSDDVASCDNGIIEINLALLLALLFTVTVVWRTFYILL